jgi:hypothetical protein
MKLEQITIDNLALMICGDQEYQDIFPYRTSTALTDFFRRVNLSKTHQGSRRPWVRDTLDELNSKENPHDKNLPSEDMIRIIEQLVDPREYLHSFPKSDYEKAKELMVKLIEHDGFCLDFDEKSKPKLTFFSGEFVSTAVELRKTERVITFVPGVFKIPDGVVIDNQVAVMMPFATDFNEVYTTIKETCESIGLNCRRADEVWKDSAIIQDVFELIFTSSIVIADLSGKNPNVFYEIGISHTLGKFVVPIAQRTDDLAFDVGHHRVLKYSFEGDGKIKLKNNLQSRLKTIYAKIQNKSQPKGDRN